MIAWCLGFIYWKWNLHVVNHWRPNMTWVFFVVFNTTLKMFWELRPQGVSSSFTQQNLPKQSLSYIGVPLGLTLLLVNLFDFLIQWRPNDIWHNSVILVHFNGSVYCIIWCNYTWYNGIWYIYIYILVNIYINIYHGIYFRIFQGYELHATSEHIFIHVRTNNSGNIVVQIGEISWV